MSPPPLNGQIIPPGYAQPVGAAPTYVFVPVPGNNLARTGADLIRTLSFGGGALAVALVLASAVLPYDLKPSTMLGNFQGGIHAASLNSSREAEAKSRQAAVLAQNKAGVDTGCSGAEAAASTLAHRGWNDAAAGADMFAEFTCKWSQGMYAMQQQLNR